MKRIKICINCGAKNSSAQMRCMKCDADISRLAVKTDCEDNVKHSENDNTHFDEKPIYFKLCSNCGKVCTADLSRCTGCGFDLDFDIIECYKIQDSFLNGLIYKGSSAVRLNIEKNGVVLKTINLSYGLCALGRSMVQDVIPEYKYVSELHLMIMNNDGKIKIADISSNGTYANGNRINEVYEPFENEKIVICGNNCFNISMSGISQ